MNHLHNMSAFLIIALTACVSVTISDGSSEGADSSDETANGDGDGDGDGETETETETGTGLDETGDGDGDGEYGCNDPLDYDEDGRFWTSLDGWEAQAQSIGPGDIDWYARALEENPDVYPTCWEYASGAYTCFVIYDCTILIGRPLDQIGIVTDTEFECDFAGPWVATFADHYGCVGLFGEEQVGVRIRPF